MKLLDGHTVQAILLSADGHDLHFVTHGGVVVSWMTEGDCCSESWFADLVGVHNVIGREVISVETIPLPEWVNVEDGRTRQEYDEAYGLRISTDGGTCDVIYRNSSNGYYGGWCGEYVSRGLPTGCKEITEDLSC